MSGTTTISDEKKFLLISIEQMLQARWVSGVVKLSHPIELIFVGFFYSLSIYEIISTESIQIISELAK